MNDFSLQVGGRLVNAFDRLQQDEDFPDSLEPDVKSSSDDTEKEDLDKDVDTKDRGGKFRFVLLLHDRIKSRIWKCSQLRLKKRWRHLTDL